MAHPKPRATTAAEAKTSVQTSVAVKPLVAQSHGGALLPGGTGAGGRPKEVWRRRCREALERADGIEFLVRVAKGEETEDQVVTIGSGQAAQTIMRQVRPKLRDRIYAAELLMEHGYGKPPQDVTIEEPGARRTEEQVIGRILELLPRVIGALPVDRKELAAIFARRREVEVLMSGQQAKAGRIGSGNGAGR